jgi:hypothetical protein
MDSEDGWKEKSWIATSNVREARVVVVGRTVVVVDRAVLVVARTVVVVGLTVVVVGRAVVVVGRAVVVVDGAVVVEAGASVVVGPARVLVTCSVVVVSCVPPHAQAVEMAARESPKAKTLISRGAIVLSRASFTRYSSHLDHRAGYPCFPRSEV